MKRYKSIFYLKNSEGDISYIDSSAPPVYKFNKKLPNVEKQPEIEFSKKYEPEIQGDDFFKAQINANNQLRKASELTVPYGSMFDQGRETNINQVKNLDIQEKFDGIVKERNLEMKKFTDIYKRLYSTQLKENFTENNYFTGQQQDFPENEIEGMIRNQEAAPMTERERINKMLFPGGRENRANVVPEIDYKDWLGTPEQIAEAKEEVRMTGIALADEKLKFPNVPHNELRNRMASALANEKLFNLTNPPLEKNGGRPLVQPPNYNFNNFATPAEGGVQKQERLNRKTPQEIKNNEIINKFAVSGYTEGDTMPDGKGGLRKKGNQQQEKQIKITERYINSPTYKAMSQLQSQIDNILLRKKFDVVSDPSVYSYNGEDADNTYLRWLNEAISNLRSQDVLTDAYKENFRQELIKKIDLSSLLPRPQNRAKGGMINYLADGGVPSYAPNPDPSYFKPKGTDTVPAMLTPGEFVVNASATAKHGDLLSAINSGKDVGYSATGGLISYLYNGGYSQRRANLANYSGSENQYVEDPEEVGKQNTADITNRIAAKNQAENNAFQMFSNTRFNDGTGSLFDNTQAGFGVSAQQALSFQDPTKPGGEGVTSAAMGMLGDVQSRMRVGNNPFGNISATGAEVNALKTAKANEPEIQKQYDEYKKFIEEQKKQQKKESGSTYASLGGLIYAVNGLTTLSPANPFATDEYLREKLKKEAEEKKQRELQDDLARQQRSTLARNAIERQRANRFRSQLQVNQNPQQQSQQQKQQAALAALQSGPRPSDFAGKWPQQQPQQQSENFQAQRAYQANQEMYGGPSAQPAFKASNYEGSFFNQVPQQQQVAQDPKRKRLSFLGMDLGSYSTGGNVDTIPAMLTPGEFVVNKQASSKNSSLLHAINSGKEVTGFRTGGSVGNIRGKKVDPIESGINELTGKLSGVGNKFVQSGDSFKSGANANEKGAQNILASSSKFNSGVGSFADSANKISKRKGYNSGGMVNYFADGGFTPRGTDTVPAMLTPGEFVVNRQSTSKNLNLLKNINGNASYMSNGGLMYARRGRAVESQQQDSTSAIDMTSVTQLADAINKLGTTFLKPFGEQIDTFKAYAEALQTQVNKIPSIINIEVMGNLNASLNIDFNPEGVYTAVTQATEELKGWIVTQIGKQLKNEMNS